jgi:lipoyl(octanoyl) transferase
MSAISSGTKPGRICDLGLMEYGRAHALQERLLEARKRREIPDTLLLVEHPPVITMGWHAVPSHIISTSDTLGRAGVPVFHTKRGGDVTFHGPGQLVVYPLLNLAENALSVTDYIWKLEETAIRTLAAIGIKGERIPGWRGVFIGRAKICSLGVRISGGVSMHGLALNVNTDLNYFDYIVPCGLAGIKVTSIAAIKGQPVAMPLVKDIMCLKFARLFRLSLEQCATDNLLPGGARSDNREQEGEYDPGR